MVLHLGRRLLLATATTKTPSLYSPRLGVLSVVRCLATRRKMNASPVSAEVLDNLPYYPEVDDPPSPDPGAYVRTPVKSAHCVDLEKKTVSDLDCVSISSTGSVVHGRYGDLGPAAAAVPLELLALLRPAAEGAAALRVARAKTKSASQKGTLLVYGASQAAGLSAVQLAASAGHAVVAVVDAQHSGNDDLLEALKGLVPEPGAVVPEEYAISKKRFAELVSSVSSGDDGTRLTQASGEDFLKDFKANLMDYVEAYPDTRPAAVSQEHLEFKYMEKDREMFEHNMAAFLEQYPPGSPPIDPAKLEAFFNVEQYEVFRNKFWRQTTGVISGDDTPFSAPHIAKQLSEAPETYDHRTFPGAGPEVPYAFSVTTPSVPPGTEPPAGGPVLAAVIVATPALQVAAGRVAQAATVRGKAEALQFLPASDRAAFLAAGSVAARARAAGAPVVSVGGSLPGIDSVGDAIFEDVQAALKAMDVDEAGNTKLNYFVQVYRANDYPFYADYAVQRATEPLAGPRQIIVTK
jgi:hypothetical protein